MTDEIEKRLKELDGRIRFLRRTLIGLENCHHVRIMRESLEKAEKEQQELISKREASTLNHPPVKLPT